MGCNLCPNRREDTVSRIQRRERPTIMSGRVVTFATGFEERPGVFGPIHEALGPFKVSASRDCVMVHRAELRTEDDFTAFDEALESALHTLFALRND